MILDFIIIMGFAFLIFLNIFLYKKKNQPSRFLIAIFSVIGIHLLNEYADLHEYSVLLYLSDLIVDGGELLLGPLILYYVSALLNVVKTNKIKFYYWFIPYIIHFVAITIPVLHYGFGIDILVEYVDWIAKYWEELYVIENLYFVGVIGLCIQKILRFEPRIKAFYSNISDKNLIWAKQMLLCLIGYQVINLSISAWILCVEPLHFEEDYLLTINIIIICFYLGYNGLFQTRIFLPEFLIPEDGLYPQEIQKSIPDVKTKVETIKEIESKPEPEPKPDSGLTQKIQHCLNVDKLYLNQNLNLRDLANALFIKEKVLSTHINQELNTSFYELINYSRVEEFKSQIKTNHNLTVMGVANTCGFKSKTSFYRIFKKATGQTPAQYQKSILK